MNAISNIVFSFLTFSVCAVAVAIWYHMVIMPKLDQLEELERLELEARMSRAFPPLEKISERRNFPRTY